MSKQSEQKREKQNEQPFEEAAAGGSGTQDCADNTCEACNPSEQSEQSEQDSKIAALSDQLLRAAAEFDNFRKRTAREREQLYADATARAVTEFLPAIDNLTRALEAPCADDNFRKGVEMTLSSLQEALTRLGVEEFGAAGDAFNPDLHNAVSQACDEALGVNVLAQVYQKGYKIGDRIIRHATVVVANP